MRKEEQRVCVETGPLTNPHPGRPGNSWVPRALGDRTSPPTCAGGGLRAFSPLPPSTCRALEHGEHFRLEIFEGCNFTGQCLEFLEDCPFLQSQGWAKSCVNAVKVYGDGA